MDSLKEFLEVHYLKYNRPEFIENDPISVPHRFSTLQDIEIAGFFASIFAWGQRRTIINKSLELLKLMDNAPFDFILNHKEHDLKVFDTFRHRTFQPTDTLYFIDFLHKYYSKNRSLETAFLHGQNMEERLTTFHNSFFKAEYAPERTRKHVATPARKSTCKRLNMYLRWMVRKDNRGVDFGLWNNIQPSELICPCDVHVERVARKLGLIKRKQTDWLTTLELTDHLKIFDAEDPVKYDFALFGVSVGGNL